MYQETVESLPSIFAWQDATSTFDAVQASALEYANARLMRALERVEAVDSELARSIRDCLQGLPQDAVVRFATAPEILYRTAALRQERNAARHIWFLCNTLMAERALAGKGEGATRPCWTALGDFYFSGGRTDPAVDLRDSQWTAEINACAPLLAGSVPLDFVSPLAEATTPCQSPFQPYTPEQIKTVSNTLQHSFDRITSVQPAAQIIARFTKVIVLRKDKPAGHSSSSMTSFPGRMLLRNPEHGNVGDLASSMIHESIHHFLYAVEFSGLFVAAAAGSPVRSPWSGRELELHSYLHACFVWYGLARFWHKQLGANLFETKIVDAQLDKALSGFRVANPVDALAPQKHRFRPESLEAAGRLWDELRQIGALDWRKRDAA